MRLPFKFPSDMFTRSRHWWLLGVSRALLAFLLVGIPLCFFSTQCRLVFDGIRGEGCLPHSVFLVSLHKWSPKRDDLVAFTAPQLAPFFDASTLKRQWLVGTHGQSQPGVVAIKQVIGIPGDHVRVDERGLWVNGVWRGTLVHTRSGQRLAALGVRATDLWRDEIVPPGHYWAWGNNSRSFDSRYWGYIEYEQILGRAVALW